jgi:hypothetical protein
MRRIKRGKGILFVKVFRIIIPEIACLIEFNDEGEFFGFVESVELEGPKPVFETQDTFAFFINSDVLFTCRKRGEARLG